MQSLGFNYLKNLHGYPEAGLIALVIADSKTVKLGGLVAMLPTSGETGVHDVALNEDIFGVCEGFVKSGIPLDNLDSGTDYDGTYTAGVRGTASYAASSTNSASTGKQVKALIRPLRMGDVLINQPDATPGTTANSDRFGRFLDIITDVQLDESSVTTSQAQFRIVGLDADDSTKLHVSPIELQFAPQINADGS